MSESAPSQSSILRQVTLADYTSECISTIKVVPGERNGGRKVGMLLFRLKGEWVGGKE